jgi:hypothetical protein
VGSKESAAEWAGKGLSDGGSVDVDFGDAALYSYSYRRPYCQLKNHVIGHREVLTLD